MPTRLFDIAGGLLHPFSNTRAFSVTLVFGVILALGYVSLRMLLGHPGSHTVPQAQRPDATVNPL